MKIKLVTTLGFGNKGVREFEVEDQRDLIDTIEEFGFKYTGQSPTYSGPGIHPRKELQDKPEFEGLCGPMYDCTREWDASGMKFIDTPETLVLRYETWGVYNRLST